MQTHTVAALAASTVLLGTLAACTPSGYITNESEKVEAWVNACKQVDTAVQVQATVKNTDTGESHDYTVTIDVRSDGKTLIKMVRRTFEPVPPGDHRIIDFFDVGMPTTRVNNLNCVITDVVLSPIT